MSHLSESPDPAIQRPIIVAVSHHYIEVVLFEDVAGLLDVTAHTRKHSGGVGDVVERSAVHLRGLPLHNVCELIEGGIYYEAAGSTLALPTVIRQMLYII